MEPLGPGARLTAEWLNELAALVNRLAITVDPSSGLNLTTGSSGTAIALVTRRDMWVKITYPNATHASPAPTASYSWVEQIPTAAGTWSNGQERGYTTADPARGSEPADPALEVNGYLEVLLDTRVRASRDVGSGALLFQSSACS